MMYWYGDHMGGGGWALMILGMVAFWGVGDPGRRLPRSFVAYRCATFGSADCRPRP